MKNAPTVTDSVNLIELRWVEFDVTTGTTAAPLLPAARSVSGITRTGRTCEVTMAAAHDYFVGQTVIVSGADQAPYNGHKIVKSIDLATNKWTFELPSTGINQIHADDLPVSPATGTITSSIYHRAQRVIVRNTDGSIVISLGPNNQATAISLAAGAEKQLPDMPDGTKFNLGDWWVKSASGTPVLKVLYV